MRFKRSLLISTALSTIMLLGGRAAMAADDYDWTGFYAGFGVGGLSTSDGGTVEFAPSTSLDFLLPGTILDDGVLEDFPGALEGLGISGTIGYNVEMDNFLFGVEASILTGPFKAESEYVESGVLSFETTDTTTLFSTSAVPTEFTSTTTLYQTNTSTNTVTTTAVQTITSGLSTTTTTFLDTMTTFQTTIYSDTTSTVEILTSSIMTTVTTDSTATDTIFSTSTEVNTYSSSTAESENSYTTTGAWENTVTGRSQIDWVGTIKGRAGFTADRTLFFVSGGVAVGAVSQETTSSYSDETGTTATFSGSNSETKFGVVVGAGVEQAIDEHWVVSGEAEYYNLGSTEYDITPDSGFGSDVSGTAKQTLDGGSVKFGIKYKF